MIKSEEKGVALCDSSFKRLVRDKNVKKENGCPHMAHWFFSSPLFCCSVFLCVCHYVQVTLLITWGETDGQAGIHQGSPRVIFILESSAVLPRKLLWGQLIFKLHTVEVRDAPTHAGKWSSDWLGLLETNMVSWVHTQISGIPPMAALILQWPQALREYGTNWPLVLLTPVFRYCSSLE